jgi:putative phosphoesterase
MMRILLVADIHSNRAALEAIREPFDVCLCMGDLVEYGPEPSACIRWVRERARVTVRGNHDHGCAQDVDVFGTTGFRYLTHATRKPTLDLLDAAERQYLASLPTTHMLTLDGLRILLVHATPRDPMEEYTRAEPAAWEKCISGVQADLICVGHTHQQFQIVSGKTRIVNPGSVGLPRDGNPLARYAIIQDGQVELKQVEYAIDETVRAVEASRFPDPAKAMLQEVYRQGRFSRPEAAISASLPEPRRGFEAEPAAESTPGSHFPPEARNLP